MTLATLLADPELETPTPLLIVVEFLRAVGRTVTVPAEAEVETLEVEVVGLPEAEERTCLVAPELELEMGFTPLDEELLCGGLGRFCCCDCDWVVALITGAGPGLEAVAPD